MDKKYTSLEHSVRNIMTETIGVTGKDKPEGTPRSFLKSVGIISPPEGEEHPGTKKPAVTLVQRAEDKVQHGLKKEEVLDEKYAGGQKTLKPTEKQKQDMESNLKNLPGAIDAGMRGAASSATFGAADHIAAAGDYAVKNTLGRLFGGKGTTYEKEYQQELEKTAKAQKEHPTAYTTGEWAPLVAGGVKAGVSAVKAVPSLYGTAKEVIKSIGSSAKTPVKSTVQGVTAIAKDLTKPIGTAAVDLVKGNVKKAGGEVAKYAKDIPSVAKGMTKFGAGLEGGLQGLEAIGDKEKRQKMFSPGGGTKLSQDVGKAGAEMAAPGSVEAVKKASEGKWKEAGKETARAVTGATIVNPSLSRFVYDAATGYLKPEWSLTGEKGVSDKIYDKATKKKVNESLSDVIKKIHKEKLEEQSKAVKTIETLPRAGKAIEDIFKLFGGEAATTKAAAETARAKAAAEAAAKAKAAKTNIVRPEFPSAGAAKPQKAPPAAPKPEKPYVDKPANVPPGVTPLPVKTPPPYKPSTDPFVPMPPANVPSKVPQRTFPGPIPEPANPQKPAAPVKKPEPGIPDKGRPAPTTNPVETKPKVTPTEVPALPVDPRINPKFIPDNKPAPKAPPKPDPEKLPDLRPAPYTYPKTLPAARPTPEPGAFPAADPAKKVADDAVVVPKTEPAKDKGKKDEGKGKENKPKAGEKPPKRRIIPFGLKIPGVSADVLSGLRGFVPASQYVHFEPQGFMETNEADNIRKTIENVARPGGKTRIGKQGEIKAKIIDENAKRAAVIKKTVKDSTIIKNPKLKHPELDEN